MSRTSFWKIGLSLFVVLVAVESAVLAQEASTDFYKEAVKNSTSEAAKDFAKESVPPATEPAPLPIEFVAWKLGSQFNLAVVLSQRGNKPEVTKQVYEKAQKLAAPAGVEIPQLPEKGELPKVLKARGRDQPGAGNEDCGETRQEGKDALRALLDADGVVAHL